MDRTLREIASAIGTPLLIDSATQNRVFGHYARVLVDMDLSKQIFNEVMIERTCYSFAIEVIYERLLAFCTHCKNIGHHITSCRWLHLLKDTHVIDKQKKSIVSQKQQIQKWQPKDNPNDIGSSKAFEAPVVNSDAADSSIPQADAAPLQIQSVPTAEDNEQRTNDVPIPVVETASQQVHHDNDNSALPLIIPVVAEAITQERLPGTSIHVLEKISEPADAHEDDSTAATQPSFSDVMELEAQTQTNTTKSEDSENTNVEIMQDPSAPVRVATVQPQEIPVSKNVQSDLDLWARIREYDERMADEGFTQVLSKKQQQAVKKQVLGKASYTRAKGTRPPSSS